MIRDVEQRGRALRVALVVGLLSLVAGFGFGRAHKIGGSEDYLLLTNQDPAALIFGFADDRHLCEDIAARLNADPGDPHHYSCKRREDARKSIEFTIESKDLKGD